MSDFYIDAADRKRIATKWLQITLLLLHIWACICIIALPFMSDADTIGALVSIFKICTYGIAGTLFILILNKGADLVINKFSVSSVAPVNTTETVTKTTVVEPVPPVATEVKDVSMTVKGDVNVSHGD